MEFLKGDNLELILRTPQNRKSGVQILNSIFQYLYDNKIYWKDFAPRNIWVDTENKRINFFDFEKGIVTNTNDKEYLQIWKNKFAQI